jgi:hypothetical protein
VEFTVTLITPTGTEDVTPDTQYTDLSHLLPYLTVPGMSLVVRRLEVITS